MALNRLRIPQLAPPMSLGGVQKVIDSLTDTQRAVVSSMWRNNSIDSLTDGSILLKV